MLSHPKKPRLSRILVVVLVLDFFKTWLQFALSSKRRIEGENDDEDEDDWRGDRDCLLRKYSRGIVVMLTTTTPFSAGRICA